MVTSRDSCKLLIVDRGSETSRDCDTLVTSLAKRERANHGGRESAGLFEPYLQVIFRKENHSYTFLGTLFSIPSPPGESRDTHLLEILVSESTPQIQTPIQSSRLVHALALKNWRRVAEIGLL